MAQQKIYPWVRQISSALRELDDLPLLVARSSYELDSISQQLANTLEAEGLSISTGKTTWCTQEEVEKISREGPSPIAIKINPMEGHLFWHMDDEDISKLSSWMLSHDGEKKEFSSEALAEGFYHYLLLEALDTFEKHSLLSNFSLKMDLEKEIDLEEALTIEVKIRHKRSSVWGRLLLPKTFRASYKEHISKLTSPLHGEVAQNYELSLGLTVGSTLLDQKSFKSIKVGDFVLLDECDYNPETRSGRASLTLAHYHLMDLSINESSLQVQEEIMEKEKHLPANPEDDENAISLKEIPITLTIELAKVKMSLSKLMKLEPGNMIELAKEPDSSVTLTVNGKKVGCAELVYLGDVLGLRILEMGK